MFAYQDIEGQRSRGQVQVVTPGDNCEKSFSLTRSESGQMGRFVTTVTTKEKNPHYHPGEKDT